MRARSSWLLVAVLLLIPALLSAKVDRQKVTLRDTQTLSFAETGLIRIEDSIGDIEIEGWDRPEVELTTIRSTQKEYTGSHLFKAEMALEEIQITAVKQGEDRLTIRTEFPSRRLSRPLRGKSNAILKYIIKAPAHAHLIVHHEAGEVQVENVTGDMELTNRFGEIGLKLPDTTAYAIDAKARIGDVCSEFGQAGRMHLAGSESRSDTSPARTQIHLRVGIGGIKIKKIKS